MPSEIAHTGQKQRVCAYAYQLRLRAYDIARRWRNTEYSYTLSHPENDRDVTGRAEGNTLQDASIPGFVFERVR